MNPEEKGSFSIYYREDGLVFGDWGGKLFLILDGVSYVLTGNPREPDLFFKGSDRTMLTLRQAFTPDELCRAVRRAVRENGTIAVISGNTYDVKGVFRLIRKAVGLGRNSVDLSYAEARLFMDYLEEQGAYSPETAVSPSSFGLANPRIMNPFLHVKRAGCTPEGKYYLIPPEPAPSGDEYSRLISNQVRFGCGYRTLGGRRQYYAWHGVPSRNDDYITYAEITAREFDAIMREYPCRIEADRETAERFRERYVEGRPILKEGWNVSL